MAVPFSVPRNQVQLHRITLQRVQQHVLKCAWNIYRFPQGFFTQRRRYPKSSIQARTDKPLISIPKMT